jgi:hypothetical protein
MTIPIWPTSLPQGTLMDGYNEEYPNNLLRFESDAGFGKTRNKGATPPFKFTKSIYLTHEQRVTLKNFVEHTLRNGALRFEYTHPMDDTTIEVRFVPSGEKLLDFKPFGLGFKVDLKLEILP